MTNLIAVSHFTFSLWLVQYIESFFFSLLADIFIHEKDQAINFIGWHFKEFFFYFLIYFNWRLLFNIVSGFLPLHSQESAIGVHVFPSDPPSHLLPSHPLKINRILKALSPHYSAE